MSYNDQISKQFRQPITIVELHMDQCIHVYGDSYDGATSGCRAYLCSAEPTNAVSTITCGNFKCFNTLETCQDEARYSAGTLIYRFSTVRIDSFQSPGQLPVIPTLAAIDTAPARINPGKDLGLRSSVDIRINDLIWDEVGTDPYRFDSGSRPSTYDPGNYSSFWRRFMGRYKYFENRMIVVKVGYLDDNNQWDDDNAISRTYFIERIDGPDQNGIISIKAKDPLKLADNDRVQIPRPSSTKVYEDTTDIQTAIKVTKGTISSDNIVSGKYVRIDDEVMLVGSTDDTNALYDIINVTRSTLPAFYTGVNEAAEHKIDAVVQRCVLWNNVRVDQILYEILTQVPGTEDFYGDYDGVNIDSVYIDYEVTGGSQWTDFADIWLNAYEFSRLITEPTGAKDLLDELSKHNIILWWDERDQQIKLDAVRPIIGDVEVVNDQENILSGSVNVAVDRNSRVSQTWIYIGQRQPIKDNDEVSTYSSVEINADLDAELPIEYGSPKLYTFKSSWLTVSQSAVANEIGSRFLNYYRDVKRNCTITLDPKDSESWTGDLIDVSTIYITNEFGEPKQIRYRVLEVDENLGRVGVRYDYMLQDTGIDVDKGRYGFITPPCTEAIKAIYPDACGDYCEDDVTGTDCETFPDYDTASDEIRDQYMFICNNSFTMDNGDPPYLIA